MAGPGSSHANIEEPERHRVTVLFADIEGSTALIQHLDAERAASLLDPALRVMVEEVERHKGMPAPRGDGIMATFGAPSVREDHALRACLAALAIRDRLASLHPDIKVRIGIHSGEVVVSRMRIGRTRVPQATGITVHIAQRIETSAEPGVICLSSGG